MTTAIATQKAPELTYIDVPRHVWDAVNNAIHTSDIDGNAMPISLCYVAVRAAMKAAAVTELKEAAREAVDIMQREIPWNAEKRLRAAIAKTEAA